jgi:demethylmenaquinone methyltransferase/2-methoxy-6-polyprenyl-1,4-benzoquinol methylase
MDHEGMTYHEWNDLMDAMEEVGPYYDRVNWLITLGMVERWRKRVASIASPEDVVLELGSGPGNFTKHLNAKAVLALEPSSELSAYASKLLNRDNVTLLKGVGERIPLLDSAVDKVFCVFSFRDFFDRKASVGEMLRVLKEGGEAIIVDMAKPPPGPLAKLIDFHVKRMVPPLTRIAAPASAKKCWERDPYAKLLETYKAYGSTDVHEDLLRKSGFVNVATEYLDLKGATMTRGKKPWKSTS